MGRALAALLLVAGCGRLAFDARSDATTSDGPGDGALPRSGFQTLCSFTSLTQLQDAVAADDYAGSRVLFALFNQCGATQVQATVSQDANGILDPTTNRPLLAADNLAILGGGDAYQRGNAYIVTTSAWPISESNDATTFTWADRATGTVVLQAPYASLTATHDYGIVVLARDPVGGASILTAFGTGAPGTLAAAYLFEHQLAAAIANDSNRWYVLEWTNNDTDVNPTPPDTFTILGSGP
jgi:hypothetical protein